MLKNLFHQPPVTTIFVNSFKAKPIKSTIAVAMILCEVADHYHWTELGLFSERLKWVLDILSLFI
jgi:hypothetical protein